MKGKASPNATATILHLDMDAFYAAVEVMDNPDLRGKPVIVGSPPDRRGVVSTASYEARKFGVRSAMPSRTAGRLCPQGVFVPVRMSRYAEVSRQIMAIIESFTPLYEQVSVDEAFLDVSGVLRRWKSGRAVAEALKKRMRREVGLTCSLGVAPNKFLAKLASDLEKPDGMTEVPTDPDAIAAFLAPMPVSRIWGVGKVTETRLREFGLRTMSDLQRLGLKGLCPMVGENAAQHIYELAFGRDDRPVVTEYEAKSISSETTFDEDCTQAGVLRQTLVELVEEVGSRLRADGRKARTGHLKLRYEDFSTLTRQVAFSPPTHAESDLIACAVRLLAREQVGRPVRLIGFGVSGFTTADEVSDRQLSIFPAEPGDPRQAALDRAVAAVRGRFGRSAVRRASAMKGA
jgi:nucleotidyltransferase/DNA polymerase involved in DNA repair